MRRLLHPALLLACALWPLGCSPQESLWGFNAITTMKTPPDPPLHCDQVFPADMQDAAREACQFGVGSTAADSLGVAASVLESTPIRHVIIMMKENRSFDHLLGGLNSQGQPGVEAVPPTFANPDLNGTLVYPFHSTTMCIRDDPGHQSQSVEECIDGGKMDGFVRNAAQTTGTDGHFVMSYYLQNDLPFYYFLATTYAISDRDFAPMASGTFGNRDYLMFGSNAGVVDTGLVYPSPTTPSIFEELMNAGYTWGAYTDSSPFSGALGWNATDPGVHTMQELYNALDQGTLPNVVFVDGKENIEDDHPDANLQTGEVWSKTIYDHAITSPQWNRLAIIWTYDEGGAFADHVPPVDGCAANAQSQFTERGPRIPLVVISPWAKRNYVSHTVRDHTAITRFIEATFGLPALTKRDANSDALLDMFDFSCEQAAVPIPTAPTAGQGGTCVDPAPPGTD